MSTSLWWLRRDLRLTDNPALATASRTSQTVIPTFIFDPKLWQMPARNRQAFLLNNLQSLDASLRERGSRLIVRTGDPLTELKRLCAETGATTIYAQRDYSPYARQRDEAVAAELQLNLTEGVTVYPVDAILKKDGTPYTVFTPYSRSWKWQQMPAADDIIPAPDHLSTPTDLASDPIPTEPPLPDSVPFPPGEAEAQQRLHQFIDALAYDYDEGRNRLDQNGTSQLSPYLRLGILSARQATVAIRYAIESAPSDAATDSALAWLNEIIWREFYLMVLHYHPHVLTSSFRPEYDRIQWDNDKEAFQAWCEGRTGFPVVDAAMRQLTQSGWMHNRARMIVASFLVKDLLIDWRWGEKFFMQHLVDGDPASNNGGWQWAAGTGTDAAPYFRIFNPTTQGQTHDPTGVYIRCWVPALQNVPTKYIHTPWKMPAKLQKEVGCILGEDYPHPIVDHKAARQRTLAAYKAVKK